MSDPPLCIGCMTPQTGAHRHCRRTCICVFSSPSVAMHASSIIVSLPMSRPAAVWRRQEARKVSTALKAHIEAAEMMLQSTAAGNEGPMHAAHGRRACACMRACMHTQSNRHAHVHMHGSRHGVQALQQCVVGCSPASQGSKRARRTCHFKVDPYQRQFQLLPLPPRLRAGRPSIVLAAAYRVNRAC